jgi:hypothetical protein
LFQKRYTKPILLAFLHRVLQSSVSGIQRDQLLCAAHFRRISWARSPRWPPTIGVGTVN